MDQGNESVEDFFNRVWFTGYHQIQDIIGLPLSIGDLDAANNESELDAHRITHVVTLTDTAVAHIGGRKYLKIADTEKDTAEASILPHLEVVFHFVDRPLESNNSRVLFHCDAGMSRSASFLIAYIMMRSNHDFDTALALVKEARRIVCPNKRFISELRSLK